MCLGSRRVEKLGRIFASLLVGVNPQGYCPPPIVKSLRRVVFITTRFFIEISNCYVYLDLGLSENQ